MSFSHPLRRIQRSQAGQASAEYLGAILVVAAILAAVSASGVGGRLTDAIEAAICRVAGETCEEEAPPRGEDEPPPSTTDSGRAPREIYDNDCEGDGELPGDLLRENGDGPTGDPEADAVYDNIGRTYDYFADTFERESYDDDGAEIIASINYCQEAGQPTSNAYWDDDDQQMKFGDGWGDSLDITAHELTHAIDSETADLEYSCQSGALDESMADIFASNVDPEDWEIGEDLPNGALRDMADPESFGDPAHVDDFDTRANDPNDPNSDFGAVHTNSSIPNHAYYLMVQDIGRDAAEQIVYQAFTEKLESDSNFEDFRSAALEAAEEIYGADSAEYRGVDESFAEVGLDGTWEAPEIEGC